MEFKEIMGLTDSISGQTLPDEMDVPGGFKTFILALETIVPEIIGILGVRAGNIEKKREDL